MRAGGCAPDGSDCLLNIAIAGADGRRISERLQPLTAPGNLALSTATTLAAAAHALRRRARATER
eukprot:7361388-Prymnesium_polylepis.1